MFYFEKSLT